MTTESLTERPNHWGEIAITRRRPTPHKHPQKAHDPNGFKQRTTVAPVAWNGTHLYHMAWPCHHVCVQYSGNVPLRHVVVQKNFTPAAIDSASSLRLWLSYIEAPLGNACGDWAPGMKRPPRVQRL